MRNAEDKLMKDFILLIWISVLSSLGYWTVKVIWFITILTFTGEGKYLDFSQSDELEQISFLLAIMGLIMVYMKKKKREFL